MTAAPVPTTVGEGLKMAFRTHPAGVAIITASAPDAPVGLTASSVASVAVDPATIVFSVTRSTGSAGAILGADTFVVHLIDDEHSALVQSFATSGAERFTAEQGWTQLETGEPHLSSARAALRCRALQTVAVGSSTVVIAEVLEVQPGPRPPGRLPRPALPRTSARHPPLKDHRKEDAMSTLYTLPELPYDYSAFEPHISGKIMELHVYLVRVQVPQL